MTKYPKYTKTGRLSGEPNIQNIPIRTDEGRQLREYLNWHCQVCNNLDCPEDQCAFWGRIDT